MFNLKKQQKGKKRFLADRLFPNKKEREEQLYGLFGCEQVQKMLETPQKNASKSVKPKRKYGLQPNAEIALDAENLSMEMDVHVVDWSVKKYVAIALANSIYLWNQETRKVYEIKVLDLDTEVCILKWDPTGNYICFADTDSNWHILYTFLGSRFKTTKSEHQISAISWHPTHEDGVICFGDVNGNVFGTDINLKTIFHLTAHQNSQVMQIEWAPSGKKFATLGYDGQIHVWNFEDLLQSYQLYKRCNYFNYQSCVSIGLEQDVFSVISWSPFCEWELLSATNKKIQLWDSSQGKLINQIQIQQNVSEGEVRRLVWGYNQDEFISGHSKTGEIVFWNKSQFQSMGKLCGHRGGVLQMIASAPSRCWLVSGGADRQLKFWKLGPEREQDELITNKFSQIVLR